MTVEGEGKKVTWENPLMPNARLRQIYVAMMQARMLARAVPARRRNTATVGIEACLVSPAIDLGVGDLVSDALGGGVVDFLRGTKLGEALGSQKIAPGRSVTSDCGGAARLPYAPGALERIWAALGAAAALKAESARAKIEAKGKAAASDSQARPAGVVLVYALPSEMTEALWRSALKFAGLMELPVLFVILPGARAKGSGRASKMAGLGTTAIRCGVPGIAVDADDAVAVYRVAQESIGHARSGGGPALMECVPFVIEGARKGKGRAVDAIAGLEGYMVERGVATRAWIEREEKSFAKRTVAARAASK